MHCGSLDKTDTVVRHLLNFFLAREGMWMTSLEITLRSGIPNVATRVHKLRQQLPEGQKIFGEWQQHHGRKRFCYRYLRVGGRQGTFDDVFMASR